MFEGEGTPDALEVEAAFGIRAHRDIGPAEMDLDHPIQGQTPGVPMAGIQDGDCQLRTACLEENYKEADTEKELFQTTSLAGWKLLLNYYRMNAVHTPQNVPFNGY